MGAVATTAVPNEGAGPVEEADDGPAAEDDEEAEGRPASAANEVVGPLKAASGSPPLNFAFWCPPLKPNPPLLPLLPKEPKPEPPLPNLAVPPRIEGTRLPFCPKAELAEEALVGLAREPAVGTACIEPTEASLDPVTDDVVAGWLAAFAFSLDASILLTVPSMQPLAPGIDSQSAKKDYHPISWPCD